MTKSFSFDLADLQEIKIPKNVSTVQRQRCVQTFKSFAIYLPDSNKINATQVHQENLCVSLVKSF